MNRTDVEAMLKVLEYAAKNKMNAATLRAVFAGRSKPVGDFPEYACKVTIGSVEYRVVFSYEEQPIGWVRHLSVSSAKQVEVQSVNELLRHFGFRWRSLPDLSGARTSYGAVRTWWDGYKGGVGLGEAFNVIEVIDDALASDVSDKGLTSLERVGNSALIQQSPQPHGV